MERSAINEEETKRKESIRWTWLVGAIIIVLLAVSMNSRIGFFFNKPSSKSYSHQDVGIICTLPLLTYVVQWRERPPTSYSVTFESCSKMMELVNDEYYESLPFTVDGFNWTLIIYPKGKDLAGYVSVYARIDITNPQLDVYAEIKFFVYNDICKQYYTYQEIETIKFDTVKPEWGVSTFPATNLLKVAGYGYTFDGDKCVFGIDVFVAQRNKMEVFSYHENITDIVFPWKLPNFSTLNLDFYTSELFSSGGRNWFLKVFPNGNGVGKDNSLSLYLVSESHGKDYVRAKLRVLNQNQSKNVEKQVEDWPNAAENGWGFEKFIPLADLQDASKGFTVDDLLKVEVEIMAFSNQTLYN